MTHIILSLKQLAKGRPEPRDYAALQEQTAAAWAALAPEIEKLGTRLPGIAVEKKHPFGVLLSMPGEKEKEAVTKIVRQQRVWRAVEAIRCDQGFVVRRARRATP